MSPRSGSTPLRSGPDEDHSMEEQLSSPVHRRRRTRTRLTGYGSRSKKSIFVSTKKNTKERAASPVDSQYSIQHTSDGELLFRIKGEIFGDDNRFRVIQVEVDATTGELVTVERELDGSNSSSSALTRSIQKSRRAESSSWIPVEGLWGAYKLPQMGGKLLVVITGSDVVYVGPPWGEIRKVTAMEIVPLFRATADSATSSEIIHDDNHHQQHGELSAQQRREVMRQVQLLRQALKDHDFFFLRSVSAGSSINSGTPGSDERNYIPDMTQTLQRGMTGSPLAGRSILNIDRSSGRNTDDDGCSRPDDRFYWNRPSVEELGPDNLELLQMTLPLTSAFVGVVHVTMTANETEVGRENMNYTEVLIARRSRFRAGTRFTKRGADATGHVANYAETEQIVLFNSTIGADAGDSNMTKLNMMSHVQTRGSLPLRWSSPADVRYRPRVRIGVNPLAQARALKAHLQGEWDKYVTIESRNTTDTSGLKQESDQQKLPPQTQHPRLIFVNLVDKKKDQGRLGRAFAAVMEAVLDILEIGHNTSTSSELLQPNPQTVQHLWFDFHAQVRHGKWETGLTRLLSKVKTSLNRHGYFSATLPFATETIKPTDAKSSMVTPDVVVHSTQSGVLRTNCMDCLDRTNVCQSIFGRYMLFRQLQKGGIIAPSKKGRKPSDYLTLPIRDAERSHRWIWADHADAISRLYAGTPALKGDFTRTGQRTKRGALDDGMNSLQRYYLQNFLDADRQEGIDLMTGHAPFSVGPGDRSMGGVSDERSIDHLNRDMSIAEAAKQLLQHSGYYTDASTATDAGVISAGEEEYVPIKYRSLHRPQRVGGNGEGLDSLNLRWIAGDLRSHIRSRQAQQRDGPVTSGHISSRIALMLHALDERAASDTPWWVIPPEEDSDEQVFDEEAYESIAMSTTALPSVATAVETTKLMNAGHIVGGLVASIQAPLATAVAVIMVVGWPSLLMTLKTKKK